jgi:hypothetical protein
MPDIGQTLEQIRRVKLSELGIPSPSRDVRVASHLPTAAERARGCRAASQYALMPQQQPPLAADGWRGSTAARLQTPSSAAAEPHHTPKRRYIATPLFQRRRLGAVALGGPDGPSHSLNLTDPLLALLGSRRAEGHLLTATL